VLARPEASESRCMACAQACVDATMRVRSRPGRPAPGTAAPASRAVCRRRTRQLVASREADLHALVSAGRRCGTRRGRRCAAGERRWERPADGAPALSGPFVPSAGFVGARAGYVFKMGSKGLGYYQDAPAPAQPAGAPWSPRPHPKDAGCILKDGGGWARCLDASIPAHSPPVPPGSRGAALGHQQGPGAWASSTQRVQACPPARWLTRAAERSCAVLQAAPALAPEA